MSSLLQDPGMPKASFQPTMHEQPVVVSKDSGRPAQQETLLTLTTINRLCPPVRQAVMTIVSDSPIDEDDRPQGR